MKCMYAMGKNYENTYFHNLKNRLKSYMDNVGRLITRVSNIICKVRNTIVFLFARKDRVLVVNGWMNLFKEYPEHQNLGDELNYYLLKELTGKQIVNYGNMYLHCIINYCCIGSIIDSLVNADSIIWGAGIISDDRPIKCKPLKIYAVRGECTRRRLLSSGIDCPKVFGDPALLLPLVYSSEQSIHKKYIGIIPHVEDLDNSNVSRLASSCKHVKIIRLCGYADWHNVIDEINECDFIISSSLHGIIISDAYKIPNVWVEFSDKVVGNGFKFRDYYSSVRSDIPEVIKVKNATELEDLLKYKKEWKPIHIDLNKLLKVCPFEIKEEYKRYGTA